MGFYDDIMKRLSEGRECDICGRKPDFVSPKMALCKKHYQEWHPDKEEDE